MAMGKPRQAHIGTPLPGRLGLDFADFPRPQQPGTHGAKHKHAADEDLRVEITRGGRG